MIMLDGHSMEVEVSSGSYAEEPVALLETKQVPG